MPGSKLRASPHPSQLWPGTSAYIKACMLHLKTLRLHLKTARLLYTKQKKVQGVHFPGMTM